MAEFDDGLVIEIDRGRVTAYSMLEQQAWSVVTGADGVGRLSTLDIVGDTIVTLTFNVEQG